MSQIRASFGAEADKLVSTLGTGGALKTKINAKIREQGIREATEVRDLTTDKTINKSINVTVNMEHIDESYPRFADGHVLGNAPDTKYKSQSGGDKYMTFKVELSDYVHTVKRKIASKISKKAKHPWMASWMLSWVRPLLFCPVKSSTIELKEKGWQCDRQLYTSEGTHLQDYFTLADYDIENNATICIWKDRVFGTKWVDVGNQVPPSLIEIKCPKLATLLAKEAKEAKGGIVDLTLQHQAYSQLDQLLQQGYLREATLKLTPCSWLDFGLTAPKMGRDLNNPKLSEKLSEALKLKKKEFTSQELQTFGIQDIGMADYVKLGDSYFRAAPLSQNHCIRADNGRYDDMIT